MAPPPPHRRTVFIFISLLLISVASTLLLSQTLPLHLTLYGHIKHRHDAHLALARKAEALRSEPAAATPTPSANIDLHVLALVRSEREEQPAETTAATSPDARPGPGISPDPSVPPLPSADQRIPRIIHQSWKTSDRIPVRFAPWMQSWVDHHPHWQYVFWTDSDNLAIFERLYPRYAYIARAVSKIALTDMARYALLHRVGGLYVDADFECRQPFDQLHSGHAVFLSTEPLAHAVLLENAASPALCNAIMASTPGHDFWLRVLESIKERYDRELRADVVSLTGPRIVKYTYEQYFGDDSSVAVLPSEYFYPEIAYWNIGTMRSACDSRSDAAARSACAWLDRFPRGEFTARTHATHHWQCTWCLAQHTERHASLGDIFANATAAGTILRPSFGGAADDELELVPYMP